jgi:proteasome accessory factor B
LTVTTQAEPKDRLERVGRLVACLLSREGPVSRDALEEIFPEYVGDSGRRRFEDDKAALRRGGVPVRVVEREGVVAGYELRRNDYELPALDLTPDEQLALHLAVRSVDFSTVPWARLVGTKLGTDASTPVATLAELPGIDLLPVLHDAVIHRRQVRFAYRGEVRQIDPWGLVLKHGRWYVPGFDRVRDGVRVFRVDRIEPDTLDDEGPDEAFVVPDGVVAHDLVPDEALVMTPGDRQTARLRADRRIAMFLAPTADVVAGADAGSDADPDSDHVIVEVEVSYVDAFVSWVLGFGELVVVESPPELRDAVVARLEQLAG